MIYRFSMDKVLWNLFWFRHYSKFHSKFFHSFFQNSLYLGNFGMFVDVIKKCLFSLSIFTHLQSSIPLAPPSHDPKLPSVELPINKDVQSNYAALTFGYLFKYTFIHIKGFLFLHQDVNQKTKEWVANRKLSSISGPHIVL